MIEIKMQFPSLEDAIKFLSRDTAGAALPVPSDTASKGKPGKPAQAEKPAASTPTAAPADAPAPAPESNAVPAAAPAEPELPYAPLAERITKAIAASNPNSTANRTALKALFAKLTDAYGTPVKTGQDVKPADRPQLAAALSAIENAAPEDAMS